MGIIPDPRLLIGPHVEPVCNIENGGFVQLQVRKAFAWFKREKVLS